MRASVKGGFGLRRGRRRGDLGGQRAIRAIWAARRCGSRALRERTGRCRNCSLTQTAAPADDTKIRADVISQLKAEPWTRPSLINVIVQDGAVELWGIVDSVSEKKAVRVAAEVTPGVRAVNDNLIIRPAESGS